MSDFVKTNIPLNKINTFRTGGISKYYCEINNPRDVKSAIKYAHGLKIPYYILGGGSSTIFKDEGYNGLIIKVKLLGISEKTNSSNVILKIGSGELLDDIVQYSISKEYSGIECLRGIPGEIGGGIVQNAGAYGQELSDVLKEVTVYDIYKKKTLNLKKEDLQMEYRKTILKGTNRYVVLFATIELNKRTVKEIKNKELSSKLANIENVKPSVIAQVVYDIRKSKSMIYDLNDVNSIGTGSFFTNPIIKRERYFELQKLVNEEIPKWDINEDLVKIPAAWLIESAGFKKGYIYKNTGLSEKHALAIINRNDSSTSEILEFSEMIRNKVRYKFNIELNTEPEIV